MQVQFLIDKKSAGADHVVGWTVLKPGASHECHLHRNCDEFFIVLKGTGPHHHREGPGAVGRRRRGLFAARLLARLQQHVERGRGAGLGLDGRRLDRGVRLRSPARGPFMSDTLNDPRIASGMRAQMELRRKRLSERRAARSAGRSALGAPAAKEKLAPRRTAGRLPARPRHAVLRRDGVAGGLAEAGRRGGDRGLHRRAICRPVATATRSRRRSRRSGRRSSSPTSIARWTTSEACSPATSSSAT